MKDYKSHILAITTNSAKKLVNFKQGFIHGDKIEVNPDDVIIASRNVLEQDANFKHIIPYILVKRGDKYLTYQRTSKGGEIRLHGDFSFGFGGHIDVGDINLQNDGQQINLSETIIFSARREMAEELAIILNNEETETPLVIKGFLYDDSNAVGSVHLGLVIVIEVPEDREITSPEDQIDLQGFKTKDELLENLVKYENWSQLLIEDLI
jgi:predicted NUDIX family phosphoesterase